LKMKRNYNIKSLDELRQYKQVLNLESSTQEIWMKETAGTLIKSFSLPALLGKAVKPSSGKNLASKSITSNVLGVALPVVLNKTLFRKSGWFTKIVVGLVSRQIGKRIK